MNVFKKNVIEVCGNIDIDTTANICNKLLELEREDMGLTTIYLVSTDISCDNAFAIYDLIRFVEIKVNVVITGHCTGASAIVLLAATGTKYVTAHSLLTLSKKVLLDYDSSNVLIDFVNNLATKGGEIWQTFGKNDVNLISNQAILYGIAEEILADNSEKSDEDLDDDDFEFAKSFIPVEQNHEGMKQKKSLDIEFEDY